MSSQTLTLDSSTLYLNSLPSLSTLPSLPPIPTDFPLPKLIPKTRFIIDGFRFSGEYSVSYFLSHFHADHYTGLTPNWSKGIIFCSHVTAQLLIEVLKVSSAFVIPLSLSKLYLIDGCEVSLIDANHCPGAVQILFRVPVSDGKFERYVHTGDFRYCDSMKLEPALSEFVGADAVFLDTTYCNPKFVFPLQEESFDYVVSVINRLGVENEGNPKSVLFLVATYVIGKEKILLEISRRCKRKIVVEDKKFGILGALGLEEDGVFTTNETESDVHVVGWNVLGETWPYFRPNFVRMNEIMNERGYSKVVGFVPTGWTYEVKRNKFAVKTKDSFEIHLVPYSEHSNYDELREYVRFLRPKRVIPTVGLDVENIDGKHATAMQKHFAGLVDEMAIKQEFLMQFHRGAHETDEKLEVESSSVTEKLGEQDNDATNPAQRTDNKICAGKVINCELPDQLPVSRDLLIVNDEDTEEMIQELRDCLPAWVTRDQMLDLLSSSGGNVVEAVSNFYEHETEFHEQVVVSTSPACESQVNTSDFHKQVVAQTSSACASQISSLKDSEWPSDPFSVHDIPRKVSKPLLQSYRSPNAKRSVKSSTSPRKRKTNLDNKPNKKSRVTSSLEPGGPKQYTITRFFSKVPPVVSKDCEPVTILDPCGNTINSSPGNHNGCYKEEVDQFIQIIDGDESVRRYAATILEETKGDINRAVDMHYSNLKDKHSEEKVVQRNDVVKGQCSVEICSDDDEPKRLESDKQDNSMPMQITDCVAVNPDRDTADIPMQELPTGSLTTDLISLPPEKYSPIEHACWKDGQPAPYIHIARTFSLLEDKKGKLRATSMLCNMFRSLLVLSPKDVLPAIYLCTNKIAPDHENMELSIGGSIVTSALEEACGTNKSRIRDLYNSLGDLGDVAQLCRQTQSLLAPPPPLSVRGVFSTLQKISVQTGSGSTVRKKNLIVNLMRSCREKEIKFLVRTLVRNLRIGAMMKTVLPALAQAVVMNSSSREGQKEHSKEAIQGLSAAVIEAYNILPNLDLLVPSLMDKGIQFTATTLSMIPGIPIKPMLAKITNGIPQVLNAFQKKAFTCEYKYDGQRAQIHKLDDGSVRVFSRNGDETTARFPDLVNIIRESCTSAASFILDAEVVAVDRKNGNKLMSFQELSSRERGSKDSLISVESIKVDICVFAFDVMFANGEQLLGLPLRQRRKRLKDLFGDEKLGYFEYAKEMTVEADEACLTDEAALTKMNLFLEDALRSSCEGIMVKTLDLEAGYTPSKRSETWLKVKRDYVEGLNDSLDLVPIGAWYGNGRKAGWYSPFLVACYNPDTEEYQSVCRVMSGFSDAFYIEMKEFFSEDKILARKPPYYQTGEVPDKWFSPELVWAIRGADFTVSPVHHAAVGLVHPSRGISIRFPRFIRTVSDRRPEECSTSNDIAEMFHSQTRKMDVGSGH